MVQADVNFVFGVWMVVDGHVAVVDMFHEGVKPASHVHDVFWQVLKKTRITSDKEHELEIEKLYDHGRLQERET